jgi:hypothetical protein
MAKVRRARMPSDTWEPTEEERRAIEAGTLIVLPCIGGPIFLDLSAGKP